MELRPGWVLPFWSQVPRATALRLALCLLLLPPRNAPAQLLCREEEYPVGTECCPKCSPGYHVQQACSELTGSVCSPCRPGTYTAHPNGLSQCLPCRVCDPALGLDTRQKCSSVQDTVCGCRQGYFCEAQDRDACVMCLPHTICHPGQRAKRRGTESQDTVCASCPLGTFSPNGTLEQCLPWTMCTRWYSLEAEPGTSSRDVTCSLNWAYVFLTISPLPLSLFILIVWRWKRRKGPSAEPESTQLCSRAPSRGAGHKQTAQGPGGPRSWASGSEHSMTEVLQKTEEEADNSSVTQTLQAVPQVTMVAVEETAPGEERVPWEETAPVEERVPVEETAPVFRAKDPNG